MSHITLHSKYGVNPSLMQCFFCVEEATGVALLGANCGKEAPRKAVYDMVPCNKCRDLMQQGIMMIVLRDGEFKSIEEAQRDYRQQLDRMSSYQRDRAGLFIPNPYRTGQVAVVRDDFILRTMDEGSQRDLVMKCRWTFIEESLARRIGLLDMIEKSAVEQDAAKQDDQNEAEG